VDQAIALARQEVKAANGENGEGRAQNKRRANLALARALALSGEVSSRGKDDKKTDTSFNESIKLMEANEGGDEASDIYQRYAQVLANRGEHEQASKYYEKAYKTVTRRY
jgi:tetratricopeptide (TPR) repeat protein